MAQGAFEREAASVGDAARGVVGFVGDEFDACHAKLLEGECGQAGYRFANVASTQPGAAAPIANFGLGRGPHRAV